jgi:ATP-dependent DNA helicase RecQ
LKILTQAGYLEYTDEQDNASRLYFTVRRDELYKLRELGEDMDKLIQIVLRSYTGVFTDYTFINENSLAVRSGLTTGVRLADTSIQDACHRLYST